MLVHTGLFMCEPRKCECLWHHHCQNLCHVMANVGIQGLVALAALCSLMDCSWPAAALRRPSTHRVNQQYKELQYMALYDLMHLCVLCLPRPFAVCHHGPQPPGRRTPLATFITRRCAQLSQQPLSSNKQRPDRISTGTSLPWDPGICPCCSKRQQQTGTLLCTRPAPPHLTWQCTRDGFLASTADQLICDLLWPLAVSAGVFVQGTGGRGLQPTAACDSQPCAEQASSQDGSSITNVAGSRARLLRGCFIHIGLHGAAAPADGVPWLPRLGWPQQL